MFFLHYLFAIAQCKTYLNKKKWNVCLKKKCADVFATKTLNTTICQVLQRYLQKVKKSFVQQKQNLVSLAHGITQY